MVNNKNFINSLVKFFSLTVIKNQKMADTYETERSQRLARFYLMSMQKTDSFLLYVNMYTIEELLYVGLNEHEASMYMKDLISLPEYYKEKLLANRRRRNIDDYEEHNTYYRMLNGLPPIGKDPYVVKGKKVTELTKEEVLYIYKDEIDQLKKQHTDLDSRYLYYLAERKISFYEARLATNFFPLYYPDYIFERSMTRKVIDNYFETLSYYKTVFYTDSFENYERYNHFMILSIVFTAISKTLTEPIKNAIRGEFDDIEALRDVFKTYSLPFDSLVSKRYLKRIVKNINKLFSYKGTNTVLIDIISLFGYDKISINKYYLIKELNKKDTGDDIIAMKDNIANGYSLKFMEVPLTVNDTRLFNSNYQTEEYDIVTKDDPYWGGNDKEDTKQKLLNADFNYINTKYLSINTMLNITRSVHEVCYLLNFISDMQNRKLIDELQLSNTEIKPSGLSIKLFDMIVAIYMLSALRCGYEDIIIRTSTGISSMYGFNFTNNEEKLKEILKKYRNYQSKKEFGHAINRPTEAFSRSELVKEFFNSMDYKDKLQTMLNICSDPIETKMLTEIFKYNCYSENNKKCFVNEKGEEFATYSDYLKHYDLEFYNFLKPYVDIKDYEGALQILFDSVDLYLQDDKINKMFLNATESTRLRDYIFSLLSYFKAYTVDIKKFNIFYLIEDKIFNSISLKDCKLNESKTQTNSDKLLLEYYEKLTKYEYTHHSDDLVTDFKEYNRRIKDVIFKSNIELEDMLSTIDVTGIYSDKFSNFDVIESKEKLKSDKFSLSDQMEIHIINY